MNFPDGIGELLIAAKERGDTFEDAWCRALETIPPNGFGISRAATKLSVETPLAFFKRHAHAAWYGYEPAQYCQADGCTRFATATDVYCADHAEISNVA